MKNLKIKFKYKELEFEMEGDEDSVKTEWEHLKINLIPRVRDSHNDKIAATVVEEGIISSGVISPDKSDSSQSLKNLVARGLQMVEKDWVLIYAFFASNSGRDFFQRKQILELYEMSKRKSTNKIKNLSQNIASLINSGLVQYVNDEDMQLIEAGKTKALNLIEVPSEMSHNKKKNAVAKVVKPVGKEVGNLKRMVDLDLMPEGKESLNDFARKYSLEANAGKILLCVYYMKEVLGIEKVSFDAIYTCMDSLESTVPPTIYQIIVNVKNRNGWIKYDSTEDVTYTISGKNHLNSNMAKIDEKA